MFDPITIGAALTTASTAFAGLKRAFQAGRDIESMTGDLSRWMSAVSDIDRAHHEAKNPPIFKKIFNAKSVEQEAIELFTQKKQLENQRDELRKLISAMLGPSAWQELLRMEADIRKQRKETLYAQREARRQFVEIISIFFLVFIIVGFFVFILWLFMNRGSL